jgi:hypothetical protein
MLVFTNPLLEEEVSEIYSNSFPEHDVVVDMIIHTEDDDYYPANVIGMDVTRDYTGKVTDNINISMMMGLGEYNSIIKPNRDKLQITIYINYNGKVYEDRFKAIVLTDHIDDMKNYDDDFKDKMSMLEITFQCISLNYALVKNMTSSGVISNTKLDDIIRHHMLKQLEALEINSKKTKPLVDITPIHNTRLYNNIVINDKITLLDIPSHLQAKYGIYNGGIGTYLYKNNNNDLVLSVFSLYNTDCIPTLRKLIIYIPDNDNPSKVINKTALLDGDELKIIVSSAIKTIGRSDDLADFDYGSGFASVNSNQVMDRVETKNGNKVVTSSERYIDSQKVVSKNDMPNIKVLDTNDNLYAVRTLNLLNKSHVKSMQWNFSRPDYLIPGMGVEIVRNYNGNIVREKGVLISNHSRYDNNYRNCITMLNVSLN